MRMIMCLSRLESVDGSTLMRIRMGRPRNPIKPSPILRILCGHPTKPQKTKTPRQPTIPQKTRRLRLDHGSTLNQMRMIMRLPRRLELLEAFMFNARSCGRAGDAIACNTWTSQRAPPRHGSVSVLARTGLNVTPAVKVPYQDTCHIPAARCARLKGIAKAQ